MLAREGALYRTVEAQGQESSIDRLVFLSDWCFCHLIPEAQALGTMVSAGRLGRRMKTRLLPLCGILGTSASS